MRNRYHILLPVVFMTGLCLAGLPLHAQDTGVVHARKSVRKRAAGPPAGKDSMLAGGRKDTALPGSRKRKKDTVREKGDTARPGQDPVARAGQDTAAAKHAGISRRASAPAVHRGRADTAAGTPSPVSRSPRPLELPSFAGRSFANHRDLVSYLLAHNAVFKDPMQPLPDIALIRRDGQGASAGMHLFYTILGIFFLLAVIRLSFTKYFSDLFRAFFNPTLSQRQLREQLSQTPFPAFVLNIFFALSAGLYLFLILRHFHYISTSRPLYLIPAFMLLILVIYLVKYIFLRFSGWLFGYQDAAAGYIFTLYMVNKVLGIALLPFILMLAFSTRGLAGIALHLSLIMIVLLFVYRYIRAYALVSSQIYFNRFHFFIYLCGFEIAPVLILGKLVLIWLNGA